MYGDPPNSNKRSLDPKACLIQFKVIEISHNACGRAEYWKVNLGLP